MHKKPFDDRNSVKKKVDSQERDGFVNPREVRYLHQWINVWNEENGKWGDYKRPVLVIKKVWSLFFVASMTTWWKDSKFYHTLPKEVFGQTSRIILSQVKVVDKKRFIEHIGTIPQEEFIAIKKKLIALLL